MSFEYNQNIYNRKASDQIVPFLLRHLKIKSVLDVGCGLGTWLSAFVEHGINDLIGLDGGYAKKYFLLSENRFLEWDLNQPFNLDKKFDLAVCLEVAEHLHENSGVNLVSSLVKHADTILFSAAIPYQGGQNHINEQWVKYWVKKFEFHGYKFYDGLRDHFWDNKEVDWWYKQNIFIVSKIELSLPFFQSDKQLVHPYPYERNSKELNNIFTGRIGFRYLMSIIFNFVKARLRK
jgi:SAM-dependent methyltransferase